MKYRDGEEEQLVKRLVHLCEWWNAFGKFYDKDLIGYAIYNDLVDVYGKEEESILNDLGLFESEPIENFIDGEIVTCIDGFCLDWWREEIEKITSATKALKFVRQTKKYVEKMKMEDTA